MENKSCPCPHHEGACIGGVKVELHSFSTSAPDGVGGQAQSLVVFPPRKSRQNALNRRLCGLKVQDKT